jgi:hypothetical protein
MIVRVVTVGSKSDMKRSSSVLRLPANAPPPRPKRGGRNPNLKRSFMCTYARSVQAAAAAAATAAGHALVSSNTRRARAQATPLAAGRACAAALDAHTHARGATAARRQPLTCSSLSKAISIASLLGSCHLYCCGAHTHGDT